MPANEEWFCTPCLLSQGDDFGFEEGEEHSLASFAARDQAFSEAWWHKFRGHPKTPGGSNGIPPTPIQGGDGNDRQAVQHSRSPSAPLSPVAPIATPALQVDDASVPGQATASPASKKGGRNVPLNPLSRRFGRAVVSEDDVEREFWRLTESSYDTVEVEYGADVHSTTHGRCVGIYGFLAIRETTSDPQRRPDDGDPPARSILARRLEPQQHAHPP